VVTLFQRQPFTKETVFVDDLERDSDRLGVNSRRAARFGAEILEFLEARGLRVEVDHAALRETMTTDAFGEIVKVPAGAENVLTWPLPVTTVRSIRAWGRTTAEHGVTRRTS
jgi:hypothetical protein